MTTETERVTIQILLTIAMNPNINMYVTLYPNSLIVGSTAYPPKANTYRHIHLNMANAAHQLHRCLEELKQLKEEL